MRRISVLGVVVGGITDIVSTNILAIPFAIFVMTKYHLVGLPKDSVAPAFTRIVHGNPLLYAVSILTGSLCSVLGGYVAARIAKSDAVLNGSLASLFCIAIGVYGFAHGKEGLTELLLGIPLSLLLGAVGGHLGRRSPVEVATAASS